MYDLGKYVNYLTIYVNCRAEVHQLKQSRGHHSNSLPRGGILGEQT